MFIPEGELTEWDETSSTAPPTSDSRARSISVSRDDLSHDFRYNPQGIPCVQCMICKASINILDRKHQYVVRCTKCGEATPIRTPPNGKQYARCVCNCLLVCSEKATRISCARQSCRRILEIGHPEDQGRVRIQGTVQVECVFCNRNFLFNKSEKKFACCPHCKKTSAVGKEYKLRWAMIYLAIAIIVTIIGAMCVAYTFRMARSQIGLYLAYVGAFLASVVLFLRSLYYFLMPVSEMVRPF